MTNFERIKNMSEKELAVWLVYVSANVEKTEYSTIADSDVKNNLYWLMSDFKDDLYWLMSEVE